MAHTILLIQSVAKHDSRSWCDFETTRECMEGLFFISKKVKNMKIK